VCYLMRKDKQNTKITNHMCKWKLHRISWLLKQYIAPSPDLNHANNWISRKEPQTFQK
jgi:hypothetical protein